MALPALVLVHGAMHGGDCWNPTVDEIRKRAPELTVLAVDLPGRRGKPGDPAGATISEWVDSVVADIDGAGLDDVVIVGHSMAGVTVPGVVAKLGARRVREMVLAAAYIPPDGTAIVNTVPGALGWYARRESSASARKGRVATLPAPLATFILCNGMSRAQRAFVRTGLHPESVNITLERVDRSDMPADVPRTWILTRRDRMNSPKTQRRSIDALGGVQTLIELDTCHDLMVSEPERLAQILIERCQLYG